jgi:hypothetical protein
MVQPDGSTPDVSRLSFIDKYGKAIGAVGFFLWTLLAPYITGDKSFDNNEKIIVALAIANAIAVYWTPLNPAHKGIKSAINLIMVALAAAQTLIVDGLQYDDWAIIIGAVLTAAGVKFLPAASIKQPTPVAVGWGSDK